MTIKQMTIIHMLLLYQFHLNWKLYNSILSLNHSLSISLSPSCLISFFASTPHVLFSKCKRCVAPILSTHRLLCDTVEFLNRFQFKHVFFSKGYWRYQAIGITLYVYLCMYVFLFSWLLDHVGRWNFSWKL